MITSLYTNHTAEYKKRVNECSRVCILIDLLDDHSTNSTLFVDNKVQKMKYSFSAPFQSIRCNTTEQSFKPCIRFKRFVVNRRPKPAPIFRAAPSWWLAPFRLVNWEDEPLAFALEFVWNKHNHKYCEISI